MKQIVRLLLLSQLFWSCAKQTNPTGGPKDADPPELLRSRPENRQTNFNSTQVELIFNEYVQVNNAREQLIIVPTIGKKFEVVARKNKVTLKFNNKLLDNTTYTINFREAIQDLTEKNPTKNLKIAFSTGTYIDSLSVEGTVQLLLKNQPAENFTVAVVPLNDTFNIFNHTAQFFTLTDKKGQFIIENLKPGAYRIYAFQDKNKNLKVDSRSEPFAFQSDTLRLYQSVKGIQLYAVALDMRPLKILSARPVGNHFLVRLIKGYINNSFKCALPNDSISFDYPDYSSIRFYKPTVDFDSISVHFNITDSINNTLDTLVYIKFNKINLQKERFTIKTRNIIYLDHKQMVNGELVLSKPARSISYDSIYIRLDSVTVLTFKENDFTWDQSFTHAYFTKQLPNALDLNTTRPRASSATPQQRLPGQDARQPRSTPAQTQKPDSKNMLNQLILAKAAILSAEGDSSTFENIPFTVVRPETTALLLIELKGTGSTITQLLDKDYKVITASTSKKVRFENLIPGEYYVRVIVDSNSNERWDPGNYYLNKEPEKIKFYKDDTGNSRINLKANWEIGPLLIEY
ncbi:MAG: Ig-like domain-containing domain [Cyclobacteriaceae bacterium]